MTSGRSPCAGNVTAEGLELVHRCAAVLLSLIVLQGSPGAQVLTGKTPFWKALEAGTPQKFVSVGSSLSQTKNSFWPSLVGQALQKQFGTLVGWSEVAWQGETSQKCLYAGGTGYHTEIPMMPTVLKSKANAMTIEFAWGDAEPSQNISVTRHKENMREIIRQVREKFPGITILLYETGMVPPSKLAKSPDYPQYLKATAEVAAEQKTYLVRTYDRFKTIYDQYVKTGREEQFHADYNREPNDHHPSARAASEIIVPAMLEVLQGAASTKMPPLWLATLPASKYYTGDTIKFDWTFDPDSLSAIVLELAIDSGKTYRSIYSGPASTRGYKWKVPGTVNGVPCVSPRAFFRIRDVDSSPSSSIGPVVLSNATPAAPITINPLAKTTYRVGDTIKISWTYDSSKMEAVRLDFSANNGRTYHSFLSTTVQGNSSSWVIPPSVNGESVVTTQAIIRAQDYSETYSAKTPLFSIVASSAFVLRHETIRHPVAELGGAKITLYSIRGQVVTRTRDGRHRLTSELLVSRRNGVQSAHFCPP